MKIALCEIWREIESATTASFDEYIAVYNTQLRWLKQYSVGENDFLSLFTIEVISAANNTTSLSRSDLKRAAERARYSIRAQLRRARKIRALKAPVPSKATSNDVANSDLIAAIVETLDETDAQILLLLLEGYKTSELSLIHI